MKRLLIPIVPLAFLAIFFFYPLVSITARGLAPPGAIDLSAFGKIVGSEFYRETLWFTFWQATVSTVLTIIAAFPAAYVMARYTFRGKSLISALTLVPFVMPTVIVAAGFMALIGPRGWINEVLRSLLGVSYAPIDIQNTIWIILLARVFYNFAVALRLISGFWANLDPQVTQAARVLGASRWRAFREVTLPLLRPAIFAAALLVFIFDFTSFGVILILGGPQFNTIATAIYRKTLIDFDLPLATALALVQLACTFAMIVIYTRWQNRAALPTRPYAIFRTLGQPGSLNYGQAMALSTRSILVVDRLLTMISPGFRCPRSPLLRHAIRITARRPRSTHLPRRIHQRVAPPLAGPRQFGGPQRRATRDTGGQHADEGALGNSAAPSIFLHSPRAPSRFPRVDYPSIPIAAAHYLLVQRRASPA